MQKHVPLSSGIFIITLFLLLVTPEPIKAQGGDPLTIEDSLAHRDDILFYGGFEQGYNTTAWRNRWGVPWVNRGTANKVVENHFLGENSLRVSYPKGGVGPGETGGQFPIVLAGMDNLQEPHYFQELYLRYYVKFEEGFDFRLGGKLPGLMGGGNSWSRSGGDQPDGTNGWSMRFMWRRDGDLVVYAYLPPSENGKWGGVQWGQDIDCNFRAEPGKWHCIEQFIDVGTPGHDDGRLMVWIDGVKRLDIDDIRYWDVENNYGRIGGAYFSTFHGGSSASWAPEVDSWAQFDGFVMARERVGEASIESTDLLLDTIVLPPGYNGHLYNTSLMAASGGVPPYRWNVETGELPAGLSLSHEGLISGFPQDTIARELTFRVRDQLGNYRTAGTTISVSSGEDVNLANNHTIAGHSDNFDTESPVDGLWDGDVSGEPANSPGAPEANSFWVEYNLGRVYRLSLIRFFGNASGDQISSDYTVETRKSQSDAWYRLIDEEDCFKNEWLETRLDDSVKHIRLTVNSDNQSNGTRARAFEVYAGDDFPVPLSIDSIELLPSIPFEEDTVMIISYLSTPSGDCQLTDHEVRMNGDSIDVFVVYSLEYAEESWKTADTIEIGRLNAGDYKLNYYISAGNNDQGAYDDTLTITFSVDIQTGLPETGMPKVKPFVYPNPASSAITVDLTDYGTAHYDIHMYSVSGQKVKSIMKVSETTIIDVTGFSPGIYIINITRENSVIASDRIIITTP